MSKENVRILLVDDMSTIRTLFRMELARLGYRNVDEAEDGQTALTMLQMGVDCANPYSIVICDWVMPAMNGLELLTEIRSDPSIAYVPFLMVTSDSELDSVRKALAAGANDYIVKPIAPDALGKKIERALSFLEKKTA
jgi:two-component system chemotaxis response regulator CheY